MRGEPSVFQRDGQGAEQPSPDALLVTCRVDGFEANPNPEREKHLRFMAELTRPSSKKQRRAKEES